MIPRRLPLVLVTADRRLFDQVVWYASPVQYADAVFKGAGVLPLILPALGDGVPLESLLDTVDGVLLTGSRSNVHPERWGEAASPRHEPYDEARDATTLPLIGMALARGLPLLAICRGFQELNVALGGTLEAEIQEAPGRLDHRSPPSTAPEERYAIRQDVLIEPGSCLGRIVGADRIRVNSLHRQGVGRLAPNLVVEAVAEDGTIEAVRVEGAPGFAVGVQWHPEFWVESDAPSARLFHAFGDAVRAHAAARRRPLAAE